MLFRSSESCHNIGMGVLGDWQMYQDQKLKMQKEMMSGALYEKKITQEVAQPGKPRRPRSRNTFPKRAK